MTNAIDRFFDGKRCLVTGGAGFLGSHVVERLLNAESDVVVLDNMLTGKRSNLEAALRSERLRIVEGDVRDYETVADLVSKADFVFHLAATVVASSIEDPIRDMETNVRGTLNVLSAAKNNPVSKIVYASSASVYGNGRYLPMHEDDPVNPLSPYAVSKLAGEHYSKVYFEDFEVQTVCLRYFNVYGPRQSDKFGYGGVFSIFANKVIHGECPVIFGDGTQTRDFLEISDAVEATLAAAGYERATGEVINVGTGIEVSVNDLACAFLKYSGLDAEPRHSDRRKVDNVRRRVANIERARRLLGYEPQVTLKEGLKRVIQFYRDNSH